MGKRVLVLGCTGSIGSQTLDIIRNMPQDFTLCGVAAGKNERAVSALCGEFKCAGTVFSRDGNEGLRNLIESCGADIAVNGISGSAGLMPSAMALEAGMDLALANKETVVMAWNLIRRISERTGARIIPVDSEHSAIFNLTQKIGPKNISQIIITASGGPFREYSPEQLKEVTADDALRHPTWNMGPKITVDSASLANKGLEVIEAVRLFDVPAEHVKVAVHPQSLVHSLVQTKDGMLYAQISNPDMRHPILGALVWPENRENYLEPFELFGNTMTFSKPRTDVFPMLGLAYKCAEKSASYTIAFNAANEAAVAAFLEHKINFLSIADVVEETLQDDWSMIPGTLDEVMEADRRAREKAAVRIESIRGSL